LSYSFTSGLQLTSSIDSQNGTWSYTYDDFDRLATAVQSGGVNQTHTYDQYGNHWSNGSAHWSAATNNRILSGVSYDDAGNVTYDGSYYYTYDGNKRVIAVGTTPGGTDVASYAYNTRGLRYYVSAGGTTLNVLFNMDRREVTEVAPASNTVLNSLLVEGGRLWGTHGGSTTIYRYPDWNGNYRVGQNVSNTGGAGTVAYRCGNDPFGDGLTCTSGPYFGLFGDLLWDSGSNTYHTPNRELSGTMEGRWLTPDPAGLAAVDLTDQTDLLYQVEC